MKKSEWIDAVLKSTGQQRMAEPNAFLYTRVMAALKEKSANYVSRQWVYVTSACIVLLCIANIGLITNSKNPSELVIKQVIQEYQLDNTDAYSLNILKK